MKLNFKTTIKPLPCPFCGRPEPRVGVDSAQSMAVVCQNERCRAKIFRWTPNYWPKGVWDKRKGFMANHGRLRTYTLNLCVKAWNRRKPC